MNSKITAAIAGLCLLILAGVAEAKTVRATDLTTQQWTNFTSGTLTDLVVEFRQGDVLPVTLMAQGDLIETSQAATSFVTVKKNFWLDAQANNVQISLDGTTFKNISDVVSGSIEADAGSPTNGGVANTINVMFRAFLK
jgi:hypothetical protein